MKAARLQVSTSYNIMANREDLGNYLVVQLLTNSTTTVVVVQSPGVILRYDGMGVEPHAAK